MAVKTTSCRITKVENSSDIDRIDDNLAKNVYGEIEFSLFNTPRKVRNEWDNLKDGEPLYLVTIQKKLVNNTSLYVVSRVRGCYVDRSVLQIPPAGKENRCARVLYDPIQYREDTMGDVEDIYSGFSFLMRCNTDVSHLHITESVHRDISRCTVDEEIPSWLREVYTGNVVIDSSSERNETGNVMKDLFSKMNKKEQVTLVSAPPGSNCGLPVVCEIANNLVSKIEAGSLSGRTLIVTNTEKMLGMILNQLMSIPSLDKNSIVVLGHDNPRSNKNADANRGPFSKYDRVQALLGRRLQLLAEVERLGKSLDPDGDGMDVGYTCETAEHFYTQTLLPLIQKCKQDRLGNDPKASFPLAKHFKLSPADAQKTDVIEKHTDMVSNLFKELASLRALELLESSVQRESYVLYQHSKIVLVTNKHVLNSFAALKKLKVTNVIMVEASQMVATETLAPLIAAGADIERLVMVADHASECPPPSRCTQALGVHYELDLQSEYLRFLRLGLPVIHLSEAPGSISMLNLVPSLGLSACSTVCSTEYRRHIPMINTIQEQHCNPGFRSIWQCIDVPGYEGKGEAEPLPGVFNNLGEAEYIVSVFQYMLILGYNPQHISVVTPHNGQKHLIVDVMRKRCMEAGLPMPAHILTLDNMQGMQNEFVLVSLTRSKQLDSYTADVRNVCRMMSFARRGLYIFGSKRNFLENAHSEIWSNLWQSGTCISSPSLALLFGERHHPPMMQGNNRMFMQKRVMAPADKDRLYRVKSVDDMASIANTLLGMLR